MQPTLNRDRTSLCVTGGGVTDRRSRDRPVPGNASNLAIFASIPPTIRRSRSLPTFCFGSPRLALTSNSTIRDQMRHGAGTTYRMTGD